MFIKKVIGIIVGFLVSGIVINVLRLFEPAIGGLIGSLFNRALAKNIESIGNIAVLIIALYLAEKVYRQIVGVKKDTKQIEVANNDKDK